jgi:hypothetical protein
MAVASTPVGSEACASLNQNLARRGARRRLLSKRSMRQLGRSTTLRRLLVDQITEDEKVDH